MPKTSLLIFIFSLLCISLAAQDQNQTDSQGRKQGVWVKKYETDTVRYKGQFRDNRPYGTFKYFYETGLKKAITTYSDDGIIARTTSFHENGKIMSKGKFINQKKDSIWLFYSELDEKLLSSETYKNGLLDGPSISYYPDSGKPFEVVTYINGLKEGAFVKYFPEGEVMTKGSYKHDTLDGDFTLYHPNGRIQVSGKYENGEQIGNWKYFDEDGKEEQFEDFKK